MQKEISVAQTMSSVLISFIRTEKLVVFGYFCCYLFWIFAKIFLMLSLGWFYHLVLKLDGPKFRFLNSYFYSVNNTYSYFILFAALVLIALICAYFKLYFSKLLTEKFSFFLRNLIVQKQFQTFAYLHHQKSFGKYLLRYSGDLSTAQKLITKGCIDPVVHVFVILTIFKILVSFSFSLTVILIGINLLGLSLLLPLNIKLQYLAQRRRDQRSVNLNWIALKLLRFDTLKVTNKSNLEYKRFVKKSQKLYNFGIQYAKFSSITTILPQFIFYLSVGCILLFFWKSHDKMLQLNPDSVFIFILLVFYIKNSLINLVSLPSFWKVNQVSYLKIIEILNRSTEQFDLTAVLSFKKQVILQDIELTEYPQNTFFKTPLHIPFHQTTFISVKNANTPFVLINLLNGIFSPETGKLEVDGRKLTGKNIAKWRKNCSTVSLNFPISGDTIWQALSFYNRQEKFEHAKKLLVEWQIDLLGKTTDDFLNTKLDRIIPYLSTRDHLVLIWIRAILANKPTLIIDDILGIVSSSTRQQIISYLNQLHEKKTIIVLSTAKPQNLDYDQFYFQ